MGRDFLSTAIFIATISSGAAAADDVPLPTRVEVEVSISPRNECRATLTRFGYEPPYRRPTGQTYRLPSEQLHLMSAVRDSGSLRISAVVLSRHRVPNTCSGYALEAVRVAGFSHVGFWFPPPPAETGESIERVSLCELAADPMRFRGRRIKVRGFVPESRTPDGINFGLMDLECRASIGLSDTNSGFWRLFGGGELPERAVVMTVTGTPGVKACYLVPPGSSCGPYFRVESFDDVQRLDLCWGSQRRDDHSSDLITRPCPREHSNSAAPGSAWN